ncbi:MAG: MFS transporter, partial [Ruminococcus sp.]|nr:MFS transporter [Ruminococcus sp.]
MKTKNITALLFCSILMLITASSDSLRGVFLPGFKTAFSLTEPQVSRIIMVSYLGNLLFLSVGGYLSDRLPRKRFIGGLLILWCIALGSYALTENYYLLLAAMVFSMGGSTMLSTSVNLITPLMFASPAMLVSIFNFVQGVGITATQNIGGRFAETLAAWHTANIILLVLAVICLALLARLDLPEPERNTSAKTSYAELVKNPATVLLILICGSYFIAEHGLLRVIVSFSSAASLLISFSFLLVCSIETMLWYTAIIATKMRQAMPS